MLRTGQLCDSCRGRCKDDQGVVIECPTCEGKGCEECDDGKFELATCPHSFIGDTFMLVQLSDLFDKGMAPIAGGVLDQSVQFLKLHRMFRNEVILSQKEDD